MTSAQEPGIREITAAPDPRGVAEFSASGALWRQFAEARTPEQFCQAWLGLQCLLIGEVSLGAVILSPEEGAPFAPAAFWPPGRSDYRRLAEVAERALAEGRGVMLEAQPEGPEAARRPLRGVAYPIRYAGQQRGVVALEVVCAGEARLQAVMRHLQWGSAWLENFLHRQGTEAQSLASARMTQLLELVAAALAQGDFRACATACVTELAQRLECERVALGRRVGLRTELVALSHAPDVDKQTNLLRAIGAAMDEALDQNRCLVHPGAEDQRSLVRVAQQALAEGHGSGAVVTVPLYSQSRTLGALTLEFADAAAADPATVALCEAAASLLGPVLDSWRRAEQSAWARLAESARARAAALLGPGRLGLKLAAGGLALAAVVLSLVEGDYRVSARTQLEGAVQRSVVAPIDGFVKDAPVRAGDPVQEGQLLARLDDRDLQLERLKWASQREQHAKQYLEAMAGHDRARIRIAKSQMDEADAQLALTSERLARTQITAPFAGFVVTGDLTQSLGAPVTRGQVLFEVAPLASYRVVVEVDERDIGEVQEGRRGVLTLASAPGERLPFAVERITPVSIPREGRNYFRVEAKLDQASPWIRPGMEGVAKIEAGSRKLVWIWLHPLIDWARLWVWSWWP